MSANDKQEGGTYYMKPIQPWDFIAANDLDFFQGTIIKYLCRWREKGGVGDLLKCQHYLEKYIELQHTHKEPATSEEVIEERSPVPCESFLNQVHASHEWDGTRTGRIATCIVCQCQDIQGTAYEVCKPKTAFCCECGKDYPCIDLAMEGHIYCGKCRYSEMHRSHVWTDTKQRKEKCTKCGCIATSTESYRPCGRGNG